MPFNTYYMEINRTVEYNKIKYRVIDKSDSGLLIVAEEKDVVNNIYPLNLFAIPDTM